jgi:hypothetical protein
MASQFISLTDLLGIPRNDTKDEYGQRISVLRYLLDTNTFEMLIPDEKITKIRNTIDDALKNQAMTLREVQTIAGLLS